LVICFVICVSCGLGVWWLLCWFMVGEEEEVVVSAVGVDGEEEELFIGEVALLLVELFVEVLLEFNLGWSWGGRVRVGDARVCFCLSDDDFVARGRCSGTGGEVVDLLLWFSEDLGVSEAFGVVPVERVSELVERVLWSVVGAVEGEVEEGFRVSSSFFVDLLGSGWFSGLVLFCCSRFVSVRPLSVVMVVVVLFSALGSEFNFSTNFCMGSHS